MAQLHLQPLDPFNFKAPDDWPRRHWQFKQFRVALGLAEDSAIKVGTLLYCLSEESELVLNSTNVMEEDKSDYSRIFAKFNTFFQVHRNVTFKRAWFNCRGQLPGETVELYIMALYDLVANCTYCELESKMIRDRLVVGIRDNALSERLQLNAELMLDKAKRKSYSERQFKSSSKSQRE